MSLLSVSDDDPKITRTAHAMLVPWGLFACQIGLVQGLGESPSRNVRESMPPRPSCSSFW